MFKNRVQIGRLGVVVVVVVSVVVLVVALIVWLDGLVVSTLEIRTRGPGFDSRVVPIDSIG